MALLTKFRLFVFPILAAVIGVAFFYSNISNLARLYQNDFWRWKYGVYDKAASMVYKRTGDASLKATFFYPEQNTNKSRFPVIVFFFGGSWVKGSLNQFYEHAVHFRNLGFVSVLADYRVTLRHRSTPQESMSDAETLMQFLYDSSAKLRIDTTALFLCGASAGGQLALSTIFRQPAVRCPRAIILFMPVINVNADPALSPMSHLHAGTPPILIFYSNRDEVINPSDIEKYREYSESLGNSIKLVELNNDGHYFPEGRLLDSTIIQCERFIQNLIPGPGGNPF